MDRGDARWKSVDRGDGTRWVNRDIMRGGRGGWIYKGDVKRLVDRGDVRRGSWADRGDVGG